MQCHVMVLDIITEYDRHGIYSVKQREIGKTRKKTRKTKKKCRASQKKVWQTTRIKYWTRNNITTKTEEDLKDRRK